MITHTATLWLRNTSWVPDYEAMILCRVAFESVKRSLGQGECLDRLIVKLTNTRRAYMGRGAWTEWHSSPGQTSLDSKWKRILVRIGKPDQFPRRSSYDWRWQEMPEIEMRTYREAIVGIVAHECGHAIGYSGRKEGEEKCEAMLSDAIEHYRRNQTEVETQIAQAHAVALSARAFKAQPAVVAPEQRTAARLARAQALLDSWTTKLRRALRKCKRYTRSVKRYETLLAGFNAAAAARAAQPEPTPYTPTNTTNDTTDETPE